jgi:hypothetical protein
MPHGAAAIILGLAIGAAGLTDAWAQASGWPGGLVWQVAASAFPIKSVHVSTDGRHGWAVGDNGTIVATEDGGGHWTPQTSPTKNDLSGVAFAADGRHGWAVGDNGTIVATEDGGGHWTPQTSPTPNNLRGVAFAADGRHGWAVGVKGTIFITVARTAFDQASVKLDQNALSGKIEVSFLLDSDPWLPVWASRVEVRTEKRGDWSLVGLATVEPVTGGNARWRLSWNPTDKDFRPGDTIQHKVVIYAGGINPTPIILGNLVFDPWWERLWREHQTSLTAAGASFGLFGIYASGFLLVLLFAPARLARVGSSPLADIPAPTGNVAFAWGLLRKLVGERATSLVVP